MSKYCTEVNCKEEAQYVYVWPWGEEGACCGQHRLHVLTRSKQLRRPVTFTLIDTHAPIAIGRDERARLRAEILVRDEDNATLKARLIEDAQRIDALSGESRRLRAREAELAAKLADAERLLAAAAKERDDALVARNDALVERDRVRLLLPRAELPTSPE